MIQLYPRKRKARRLVEIPKKALYTPRFSEDFFEYDKYIFFKNYPSVDIMEFKWEPPTQKK